MTTSRQDSSIFLDLGGFSDCLRGLSHAYRDLTHPLVFLDIPTMNLVSTTVPENDSLPLFKLSHYPSPQHATHETVSSSALAPYLALVPQPSPLEWCAAFQDICRSSENTTSWRNRW